MLAGVRLAFSWLTVLPVPVRHVDRTVAGGAIAAAPLVGLVLGGAAAGLLLLFDLVDIGGLLAGFLVVAFLALVLTLGVQAAAINDWPELILAVTTGRVAFVMCCHGVPPARAEGLG